VSQAAVAAATAVLRDWWLEQGYIDAPLGDIISQMRWMDDPIARALVTAYDRAWLR
jgi:hypothetical protein